MKKCSKCDTLRELEEFPFRKDSGNYRTWCRVCERIRVREYGKKNPSKIKKTQRTKYLNKQEHYKQVSRDWRRDNPERLRTQVITWRKSNPERARLNSRVKEAKRRASKLRRTPSWADLDAIKEFYRNCPPGHHVDHIIPLQGKNVSGFHILENLQYLTASENCSKGNKYGE